MSQQSSSGVPPASEILPPGWTTTTLGDICSLNPKLPVKPEPDSQVTFVPMAAVCEYTGAIVTPQSKSFSAVSKGYTPFIEGDVIWAKITPCMENGKAAIARDLKNGVGAGSTEFFVLRSKGRVLPEYLHRFVRQENFRAAAQKTMNSAVGQARVPKDFLLSAPIPLPPLPEQRRIVARLEALEARSRRARAKLAEVPAQLAQARQSLLAAAFRGDLTADWREAIKAAEWRTGTIDEVCTESFYGPRFSDEDYTPKGIPTIRTTDFTDNGLIELRNTPRVMVPSDRREKFLLRSGDLLVTRTGSIGKMAIFRGGYEALHSAYLIRFRFTEAVTPDFVFNCLSSPHWQSLLGLNTTAVTQPNINAEAIRRLPIPLPPLPEQNEIVRRLGVAFTRLEAAANAHAAAVAALDRLDQALLARAFSGGLVAQETAQEPARPAPADSVQAQTYLLRFIPALLRAAGHPVSLGDLNRVVALRFLPAGELLPVVEQLGGPGARAHFAASPIAYEDGAFLAAMRLLRRTQAIAVAPGRRGIQTLSLGAKPPPSTPAIDADARHLALLLGRVPAESVTPTLRRLQSVEVGEALLATP